MPKPKNCLKCEFCKRGNYEGNETAYCSLLIEEKGVYDAALSWNTHRVVSIAPLKDCPYEERMELISAGKIKQ